jgi:hypothetical protein
LLGVNVNVNAKQSNTGICTDIGVPAVRERVKYGAIDMAQ